jgi:hypothetical protein
MTSAILAAVASGVHATVAGAVEAIVAFRPEEHEPEAELREVYDEAYRRYRDVFFALKDQVRADYVVTAKNGYDTFTSSVGNALAGAPGVAAASAVRGPGVVGKQPILKPGESFEYTSGCPLSTPFGVMLTS